MENVLLVCVVCLSNLVCLTMGARIGQKANKEIRLPDPVGKLREVKQSREREEEQKQVETMLYNIDVYDGTELGQKSL